MALEAGQPLGAGEAWRREAVSAREAAPQRGEKAKAVAAVAPAPSERQRPWAKVREPEEPADRGGPAPARLLPGSLGPEAP